MKLKNIKSVGVAALTAAVVFTGCGNLNPDAALVTINTGDGSKDTITLGYGNFSARYQQALYDQFLLAYYGEGMWSQDMYGTGTTMQDETKQSVLDRIEDQYVAKLHASDYGVALSEDQNKAIADAAAKFIADNSKESLEEMGATEEYVKQYLEYETIYNMVSEAAKKEADKDITDEQCWMRSFSFVLFDTTGTQDANGSVVAYTEEEIADMKAKAEELSKADDFAAAVEADDALNIQNYSYLKGETEDSGMDMAIIDAAEKLKEGETSGVVEVDGVGFYVLHLESDHDEDASANKRESLQADAFNKLLETWKAAITWEVDDKQWAKVEFDDLFKAPAAKEEATEQTEESTEATEESTEATEETEETTEETESEETEAE